MREAWSVFCRTCQRLDAIREGWTFVRDWVDATSLLPTTIEWFSIALLPATTEWLSELEKIKNSKTPINKKHVERKSKTGIKENNMLKRRKKQKAPVNENNTLKKTETFRKLL